MKDRKDYMKNYYEENKEDLKIKHKNYYETHKEKYKTYYKNHKEKYKTYHKNHCKCYKGFYLYIIVDLDLNKDVYVGSTTNLYIRIATHKSAQKIKEITDKGHKYLVKYIKVSDYLTLDINELRELEQYFINNYLDDDSLNNKKAATEEIEEEKIKEWINIYLRKRIQEGKVFFDIFTKLNSTIKFYLN